MNKVTVLTKLDILKDKLIAKQHGHHKYRDGSVLPSAKELIDMINNEKELANN